MRPLTITKEYEAYIREHYRTDTYYEQAKVLGISYSSVAKMCAQLGLVRTKEESEQIRKRGTEKRKEMYDTDKERIQNGLQPLTKIRVSTKKPMIHTRCNLCCQRGYIYHRERGDMHTLYYNENTRRVSEEREQYYNKVFGLKFKQEYE